MKLIHNCSYITESISRIDCLKPYISDIDAHGNYGTSTSKRETEFRRADRFLNGNTVQKDIAQASEIIGDRKLTWLKIELLSSSVYFKAIALWGTDLFMTIGRSDWNLNFYRYEYDFVNGAPITYVEPEPPAAPVLQKHPLENVWVPHECAQCGKVDNLVNVHSLVYAGNPQCHDCDDSMEPVSGEVEIEDMNARVERMKGGAS